MDRKPVFSDRQDAGRKLAEELYRYRFSKPVVLALPLGGIPVAFEVASRLGTVFDVIVARKLGVPNNRELGFGAIAEGGILVINSIVVDLYNISPEIIQETINSASAEMEEGIKDFRGNRHNPDVTGKTVVLVDDGIASGITARAAIAALRQLNATKIIFAAPVCDSEASSALQDLADEFICLHEVSDLSSVSNYYENFSQLTKQQALDILHHARQELVPAKLGANS